MTDLATRHEQLSDLVAYQLGIDLARYPTSSIEPLLSLWPEPTRAPEARLLRAVESTCAIGETAFLRRPEHFAALRRLLLPLCSSAPGRPLKVWSAGCSTGEEAYSLAAVLAPLCTAGLHVLATDVRAEAIAHAQRGIYRQWSLRRAPAQHFADWLAIDGDRVEVRPFLRPLIEFRVHNLMHDPYPQDLDIIFCRNVLVYFVDHAAESVFLRLAASLRPGGVLFTADCDPTPRVGTLAAELSDDVVYYRRLPDPLCALEVVAAEAPSPGETRLEERLGLARRLTDQRSFAEGLQLLCALAAEYPLAIEPNVLAAFLALEAGQGQAALDAARRACFLAANEPICHFLMGAGLDLLGESRQARIHFRTAAALLPQSAERSGSLRYGEGMTANQLQRIIDGYLFGASTHVPRP